ncbi:PLP-dependent transferase [Basidiobolus meristosporus CBS 931.73]|uniref:PLP-dependent transferase n=1 Tax=Basidiobolus meristosporus CBS 931.73 TaxID=1314790 RepID=A0A1Y1XTL7_9FUNG|nr:PLP-dependent transferase [Basidiobolus meristosporus CBS 931.73]|eukprot:ORX89080.1 PLP-dependent transferase [Basidiobolus meristosporus CBS 931.73]
MSRFLRKTFTPGSSLARLSQQIRYQSIASATHQSGPSKVTHPDADNNPKTLEILAESDKYILNTYSKPSLVFTHGKGCYLYDQSNRRYLDFCAGIAVNALGHADEEMTQVLAEQASQLVHLSNLFHHQWSGGVDFLRAMRKRCDEVGALTGKLWAFENFPSDVVPDILTLAKPLANGFPIGAILMNDKVADKIKIGDHGTTFGGNPLGCRVALSVFNRISRPEFLANVNETGAHLKQGLRNITNGNPLVKEVRGLGLILGVEFTVDPTPIVKMARERGLIVITASNNTVRLVPPLILTKEEADQGLAILKDCFEEFKAQTPV